MNFSRYFFLRFIFLGVYFYDYRIISCIFVLHTMVCYLFSCHFLQDHKVFCNLYGIRLCSFIDILTSYYIMIDEFCVLCCTGSGLQSPKALCHQHDLPILLAAPRNWLRVLQFHQLHDCVLPAAALHRQLHGAGPRALLGWVGDQRLGSKLFCSKLACGIWIRNLRNKFKLFHQKHFLALWSYAKPH